LGRVNQNLQEIVCTDIIPEKIGPFVRQTLNNETGAEAFLPAAFAINLLPDDFKKKLWTREVQEKINRLSSASIGQCISLSKFLELVAPIANPFTDPSRELFFHNFFEQHICVWNFEEVAHCFAEKPEHLDIFHANLIQSILRSRQFSCSILQYIYEISPQLCKNPNSLTNHEKKQIFKFVQFLPPLETLSSSLHTDSSLELIHKLYPEEALRIIKGITPLKTLPSYFQYDSIVSRLELIHKLFPEEALRIIKGIPPLREAPTNSQIAVLKFIERISAEKLDGIVKNIRKNSTFKERFSDKWHIF
ncbi:MAG: hypothetical protein K2P90_00835, partial [Holosporales bacterium]|nr:hypothetical protein [Holosporales bacterium]